MSPVRLLAVAAALAANVALAAASGPPALAWIHPVAPPLTHIPEMGEAVLAATSAAPTAPGAPPSPTGPTDAAAAPSPAALTEPAAPPGPPTPPAPRGDPPAAPPRGPPPLHGLAGFLDQVVRATGTPPQKAAISELRALNTRVVPHARRAHELRVAVQADAVALAEALGPARVARILAEKDALSTRIGEGRAWAAAIERLR